MCLSLARAGAEGVLEGCTEAGYLTSTRPPLWGQALVRVGRRSRRRWLARSAWRSESVTGWRSGGAAGQINNRGCWRSPRGQPKRGAVDHKRIHIPPPKNPPSLAHAHPTTPSARPSPSSLLPLALRLAHQSVEPGQDHTRVAGAEPNSRSRLRALLSPLDSAGVLIHWL